MSYAHALLAQRRNDRPKDPPAHPRDLLGRLVVGVLVAVTVLSVIRCFGPLSYPGDIWRQADTATIARNFARNGMDLFFPQIDWGGAGPGYVETELPLMPWLTGALYLVFGEQEWLGRLVSLAFMLVAAGAFWGLVRRLLPAAPARWAMIAFLVSPVFIRWGTAFMPEATVLAFTLLTLLFFGRWIQEDSPRWLVAAGAALAMAALVKPTSLHLGLVLVLWLAFAAPRRLRRPSLYAVGVAALVPPALWLWHAAGLYSTYGNTFGVISGGDSKFGSLELWLSAQFYLGNLRTEVLFVYGVLAVVPALIGAAWLARARRRAAAAPLVLAGAIGVSVYYFAAGRYTSSDLGVQYHVFSLPYAAIATGIGMGVLAHRLRARVPRPWRGATAVLVVLLLGAQSLYIWGRSFEDGYGVYGVCAARVSALSAPDDLVVVGTDSASVDGAVPNNYEQPIVHYRADRRGWVLAADWYDRTDLVAGYRDAGARFFVDPFPNQLTGPLRAWLAGNAVQVTSAAAEGCDIWRLGSG